MISFFTSAFLSTQKIRIYLNLRRRADHEIALPAAVGLDGCFAYPSGRREDADRHVQTCNTNRFLSISPTEWEGMKALASWKRPKTPGDVSPPGSGILYGWCLQLGQVLLVAFGRRIAGSFCMLLWFRCFRGVECQIHKDCIKRIKKIKISNKAQFDLNQRSQSCSENSYQWLPTAGVDGQVLVGPTPSVSRPFCCATQKGILPCGNLHRGPACFAHKRSKLLWM